MKPRIKKLTTKYGPCWACAIPEQMRIGYGKTPEEAFEMWKFLGRFE